MKYMYLVFPKAECSFNHTLRQGIANKHVVEKYINVKAHKDMIPELRVHFGWAGKLISRKLSYYKNVFSIH
jgi:hypothetical protein